MPRIVIENGPDKGRTIPLPADAPAIAGRDAAAAIGLRDEMASRRHFQIRAVEGRFQLEDLGSKNGVLLNGKRLEKKIVTLAPNDRIQVGETLLTFVGDDPHPLLGREISGYRIEDRIGRGGMGTVYRAVQLSLDRTVAMKILAPHLVENQNFINLFIREARAAGALSHPNLVQVYDVGVEENVYFYSMEYIPHGSVEELLNREKKIAVGRALEIVRDAALGLQYAELKGLVHRDIKPGNLMIGTDDIIKIGDLGIARFGEEEGVVSQKDGVSGSPHYIAPEQARGLDIDHRADLYALGVSFYQMLCGSTPYRGSTPREVILAHLKSDPPPLAERAPEVPPPVLELVEAMMQKNRDERVPSATAVLERLEPLLRRYRDGGTGTFEGRRRSPVQLVVGLVLLGVLSVGITLGVMQQRHAAEEREKQIASWRGVIEQAEGARDREELVTVLGSLDELGGAELPDDLVARRGALEEWTVSFREAQERAARDAMRERAFTEVEERVATIDRDAAIAAWEAFARDYPDTPEGERAASLRDSLIAAKQKQAADERSAALQVDSAIDAARTFARDGNYPRAIERIETVDSSAIAGTRAAERLRAAGEELRSEARTTFERLTESVRASIEAEEFDAARRAISRFRAPAFLETDLAALRDELSAARSAARDTGPGETVDRLAIAVSEALAIWAAVDIGSRGENSQRAALSKLGIDLRTQLEDDDRAILEHLIATMGRLPDFLERAGSTILPESASITVEFLEGDPRTVTIEEYSARNIVAVPRGSEHATYIDWADLTPASRLAVVQTSSNLPREEFPVYGWFVLALGDRATARMIWNAAPSDAAPVIGALREATDRLADR